MYTRFQLAKKYIQYYLTSANGKGHGVHSPFVFNFIKFVLNDRKKYAAYNTIENSRKELLQNTQTIEVADFGAGSTVIKTKQRRIKDIAASSLKPKKYSALLMRMIQYYQYQQVVELGTSLGVTTCYIAAAQNKPSVVTMEGAPQVAKIAQHYFKQHQYTNIKLIEGNFDITLSQYLQLNPKIDLVFIDGNHRKQPTINYFHQLLAAMNEEGCMVFDDIHWSAEMEAAWAYIKAHESVTLSIDLFFIGIVFFKKDFKVKQHFTIRF
ncbi:O-methyltransferase [Ferruginibacter yonginensis]|uniref:O-methyltransferase n=1 Tax=Ferruginibacter yonginensis TaxID=1310416 RepID=A0ABV8QVU1_9BACT